MLVISSYPTATVRVPERCANTLRRGRHLAGGNDMPKGIPGSHGTCSLPNCEASHYALSFCQKHYARAKRHGDPFKVSRPYENGPSWQERFWRYVERGPGCWEWKASKDRKGYGHFSARERGKGLTVVAHRISYELLVGPIPDGLTLDHLCQNTSCVNPAHLEPVTVQENLRRGKERRPAWRLCKRGHTAPTGKACKECKRLNYLASKADTLCDYYEEEC